MAKWKVTASAVNVRTGPSTNHSVKYSLPKNSEVTSLEMSDTWIKIADGEWMNTRINSGPIMIMTEPDQEDEPTPQPEVNEVPAEPQPVDTTDITGSRSNTNTLNISMYTQDYNSTENITIRNAMSILGLPYQFLPSADTPLSDDGAALGRKYAEKIISRVPLLLLTPGEPKFMTNYNNQEKRDVLEALLKIGGGDSNIESFLSNERGRYYTFNINYVEYYKFLNPMCRMAARLLNLQNETLDVNGTGTGTRMDQVNWMDFTAHRIESFTDIGLAGAIPFYVQSETQISESFSNSTGESMLASTVNPLSDLSREIGFMLGYGSNMLGTNISPLEMSEINDNIENAQDLIDKLSNKSNFMKNLSGNVLTVASGGKLIFPEIWNDSSFLRTYNINLKFTTPDCDTLSWYLNICVPLLHLIALVAPRGIDGNAAGYMNPFLVRGYYKGLFNCDMGIITDMTISKGTDGGWTKEGLPTVVEVSLTLKDLYDVMSVSSGMAGGIFTTDAIKNTALMDYIANFCGININKPEVGRQIDIWFTQTVQNRVTDAITKNIWGNIEQSAQNSIMNVYNVLLR